MEHEHDARGRTDGETNPGPRHLGLDAGLLAHRKISTKNAAEGLDASTLRTFFQNLNRQIRNNELSVLVQNLQNELPTQDRRPRSRIADLSLSCISQLLIRRKDLTIAGLESKKVVSTIAYGVTGIAGAQLGHTQDA